MSRLSPLRFGWNSENFENSVSFVSFEMTVGNCILVFGIPVDRDCAFLADRAFAFVSAANHLRRFLRASHRIDRIHRNRYPRIRSSGGAERVTARRRRLRAHPHSPYDASSTIPSHTVMPIWKRDIRYQDTNGGSSDLRAVSRKTSKK